MQQAASNGMTNDKLRVFDLTLEGTTDLPNGLALSGLQVATDTAAGWRCANLPTKAKGAKHKGRIFKLRRSGIFIARANKKDSQLR
jgi:hypothetical protein